MTDTDTTTSTAMTTTITDVRTVAVPVADQDAAVDFSIGTLGFEVRMDAQASPPMFSIYDPDGDRFVIVEDVR